ncbi:MAG: DNA alkylation repair protein [Verrucomicrobia bacterium]|nr:DNA alkylation repair protein [Verrucomicrobiota bacterium]
MNPIPAILQELNRHADPARRNGMARFGINTQTALGVSIPTLRKLARHYRHQHDTANALWQTEIHEARILASMMDDPALVTPRQMEDWVCTLHSWDLCDQLCINLFSRTPHAHAKALAWRLRKPEYIRRAGFVLMAALAVHDKSAADDDFSPFLEAIRHGATDSRNFVKKAVNWALRQIGKRNPALQQRATQLARELLEMDDLTARWIARDALREFAQLRNRRQ